MTTYRDTSAPGDSPITASGQVYEFGAEVDFYLSVSSNLISGQATGPSVAFTIYSRKVGPTTVNIDYGTTDTNYEVKRTGYLINCTVPAGTVSCRVVISSEPFPLTVQTVTNATIIGTVTTDIGSTNSYSKDATLTGGNLLAKTKGAQVASGAAAPYDGIARLTASVTDAMGVSVSDGTTTQKLAPLGQVTAGGTASVWENYEFAVVGGTTYTLSGSGLIILGGKYVVH